MPKITAVHESLPYIDKDPTQDERAAAEALISAERLAVPDDPFHALLAPAYEPHFTPAVAAELVRVSASLPSGAGGKRKPLSAIDLSRYEAPEDPEEEKDDDDDDEGNKTGKERLRRALCRAYAAHAYLRARRAHLALLDTEAGRNSWLVGNWQLEAELRAVEAELAAARRAVDEVTIRRRAAQEAVAGELAGLEEAWRRGVGRAVETEVAAETLRQRGLEERRRLAAAAAADSVDGPVA